MALLLVCRDAGYDCPFVARGETMEEVLAQVAKHAKEVHGCTDEQLNDSEMIDKIKAAIKQT